MTQKKSITPQTLLAASITICKETHYDALSLSKVAQALHIKTPSLYNHIESLDHLKQEIANEGIRKLYDQLLHSVAGKSNDDAILEASKKYLLFVEESPELYAALSKPTFPDNHDFDVHSKKMVQLFSILFQNYRLDESQTIYAVRGLRSILHGFASIQSDGGFRLDFEISESLTFIINTYLEGLKQQEKIR